MGDLRLGDVIDDFCVKCRRLTNHSVVSLVDGKAAKVRCRTCYSDHDYRNEQAPPSKKDLKKAALFAEVLTKAAPAAAGVPSGDPPPEPPADGSAQENASQQNASGAEKAPTAKKEARRKKT
ncbi:MAG TPA: hypothetical protein VIY49_09585 [Bryobacteraceae bacterium]